MNDLLVTGSVIVTLALIAYSIGIRIEQKWKLLNNKVIIFLTTGLILDITATCFMIIGSGNSPFTVHGVLGYSALLAMFIETILVWRYVLNHGLHQQVTQRLHLYSRYAYLWWVVVYFSGGIIAMVR